MGKNNETRNRHDKKGQTSLLCNTEPLDFNRNFFHKELKK